MAKQRTTWKKNTASDASLVAYNSTALYNSVATYNGLVTDEPRSTDKKPTAWSKQ